MRSILNVAFFCLFATPAFSQESCRNAVTQSELNQCAYDQWQIEDDALNDGYAEAMKLMKQIDADLPSDERGGAEALREAQRAWIVFRDNACKAAGYPMHGGSAEPLLIYGCMRQLTLERANHLWSMVEDISNY
jgi:uncharacterized protein YecT (DUF1311 family)